MVADEFSVIDWLNVSALTHLYFHDDFKESQQMRENSPQVPNTHSE